MAKFIVSLTEYTFFAVPVEAESPQEAEQKARHILATDKDYSCCIDSLVALNDEADGDPPGIDEVDDDCFARYLPPKAA